MAGLGQNVGTDFSLRARANGFTTIAGNPVALWYFDEGGSNSGFMGNRFLPSAHFELIQGEMCNVQFLNASNMTHTIHLHGMDVDQANDGVETTSMLIPPFGSFTYQLVAPFAGTYHYHCHVDTVLHYHRGMAGTVIVRPPGGATNIAWEGGPAFDEEVLWQLNTYDFNWGISQSSSVTARHRPTAFLLNGLVSADAQVCPYTIVQLGLGKVGYIRVLNQAYQFARFSLGGLPFQIVATDGRPMPQPIITDSWEIGTGERYEIMFSSDVPYKSMATIDYLDDYTGNVLGQVSTIIEIGRGFLPGPRPMSPESIETSR